MEQQIIKLKVGMLRITESQDSDYPGVWVEYMPDDMSHTISQVLVEQPCDTIDRVDYAKTRVLVWESADSDDYDHNIDISGGITTNSVTPQEFLKKRYSIQVSEDVVLSNGEDVENVIGASYWLDKNSINKAEIDEFRSKKDQLNPSEYNPNCLWYHEDENDINPTHEWYMFDEPDEWIPVQEIVFPDGSKCWYEVEE